MSINRACRRRNRRLRWRKSSPKRRNSPEDYSGESVLPWIRYLPAGPPDRPGSPACPGPRRTGRCPESRSAWRQVNAAMGLRVMLWLRERRKGSGRYWISAANRENQKKNSGAILRSHRPMVPRRNRRFHIAHGHASGDAHSGSCHAKSLCGGKNRCFREWSRSARR